MSTQQITSIPYANSSGIISRRLIVKPNDIPAAETADGIIIPENATALCESGTVISVSEGSLINVGDTIEYRKIERRNRDEFTGIEIEGEEYDLIFENEVWSVNEQPFNRLFIEPLGELVISESGIILPDEVKGIPQKGIIHAAPAGSLFTVGSTVEYRKAEQGMYPSVSVDGRKMDVLFERDIFTVDGEASPYKIIVKIDILAQHTKRKLMDNGLERSPLYLFMMHNLQYGQVTSIGSEAQKMYPHLRRGDFAILHHTIEHQPYRILKQKKGRSGFVRYEYRMINCFNFESREIFGKMKRTNNNEPLPNSVELFNKALLLKWDFSIFEKKEVVDTDFINMDFNLNEITNIDDLHQAVDKKRSQAVEKYKTEFNRLTTKLGTLNPAVAHQKEEIDILETRIEDMRRDSLKKSAYVNGNHKVVCTTAAGNKKFIATYKELYPISLLDKKYLIAYPDFILGQIPLFMSSATPSFMPVADRVQILPLEEKNESDLILPESTKEKPIRGKVISVGPGTDSCKMIVSAGDTIYFKRFAGNEITIDGTEYLIMRQNDLLGFITPEA